RSSHTATGIGYAVGCRAGSGDGDDDGMKYHHSFHAGNFADVHKHVALLALLRALQRKNKGFLYLETHAGAGAYDLVDPSTHQGAEARGGISALTAAAEPAAAELREYLAAVAAWRAAAGQPRGYPGSAVLAAQSLRAQDRCVCCELQSAEHRALRQSLRGFHRVRTACEDGYRRLAASLPARERRALVLIDPPYESAAAEIEQALAAVHAALERMANTVIALWYPLKDERWLTAWQRRVERELGAPAAALELWLYPRDGRVALNGSGLLIVNPPYQIEQRARYWQHELLERLQPGDRDGERGSAARGTGFGASPGAGSAVRTLVAERPVRHAGA
ncbi:MAG TPA: 23S rRNA (adenine(2030)-N(6))-methyltransferase RlmJ, partial [Steroidobacteraceae bacterium]|nr:23S rRNA (adenine(2030)-N(6))-methyltransferase RlmJ [Steroidobacteraceae bacterium]